MIRLHYSCKGAVTVYPPMNSILISLADTTSIRSMILATRVSEYLVIWKSETVSWRSGFAAFCWLAVSWSICFCRLSISSLACFNFSSRKDASHSRDRSSRRSNSCRASASFCCNSSSSVVPPCKSCRIPLICMATSSV